MVGSAGGGPLDDELDDDGPLDQFRDVKSVSAGQP